MAFSQKARLKRWPRSQQRDLWWLLDNVLKPGEHMELIRDYDHSIRWMLRDYRRLRGVPRGAIEARSMEGGRTLVLKVKSGYEKPDQ